LIPRLIGLHSIRPPRRKRRTKAQLANARVDSRRYADLLKTDGITQQIYARRRRSSAQLEATVKADQAAIDSAKVNLDYTTILSPIDGRVGIRQVDAGKHCSRLRRERSRSANSTSPHLVVFTLPEQSLTKLQQYQNPEKDYIVLAVSRDNTNMLDKGALAVIDNQIDTTTGTIKLKATFANEIFASGPVSSSTPASCSRRARTARLSRRRSFNAGRMARFAFVIQDDQTVTMRPLKVAQIESGMALIDEGLKPGERIVVDGQYKLQPGSHVQPQSRRVARRRKCKNVRAEVKTGANPNRTRRLGHCSRLLS